MAATTKMISAEDRAAIKGLIEGAAGKVAFDESIIKEGNSITQGLLWNQNKNYKDLVINEEHNWSGDLTQPYPNPVYWSKQGQPAIFVHQGSLPKGSKAGVVYADGNDSTARKWLVAFDTVNNKVYVEAGAIGPTDWNVVEVKLDGSGSESSSEDPAYHGKAYAEIHPNEQRSLLYIWFRD